MKVPNFKHLNTELILLLSSWVTASIKISEPVLEVVMQTQALTLPSQISLYGLNHEQILSSSTLHRGEYWSHLSVKLCCTTFEAHLCTFLQTSNWHSDASCWWGVCISYYGLYFYAHEVFFKWWTAIHPCTEEVASEDTFLDALTRESFVRADIQNKDQYFK